MIGEVAYRRKMRSKRGRKRGRTNPAILLTLGERYENSARTLREIEDRMMGLSPQAISIADIRANGGSRAIEL
jgi:hypothetical protein